MKIDYSNFLQNRPKETDPAKIAAMKESLVRVLKEMDVHGHISCEYYADGCVKVSIDGAYYNVFDSKTDKFFSGYVGDEKGE